MVGIAQNNRGIHFCFQLLLRYGLFKAGEILGLTIASLQNLAFYLWLVRQARAHVLAGDFLSWKNETSRILKTRL